MFINYIFKQPDYNYIKFLWSNHQFNMNRLSTLIIIGNLLDYTYIIYANV